MPDPVKVEYTAAWTCAAGHDVVGPQNVVRVMQDDTLIAEWLLCNEHAEAVQMAISDEVSRRSHA